MQDTIGLLDAEHFRKTYINQALEFKVIEMTVPEKSQIAIRSTGSVESANSYLRNLETRGRPNEGSLALVNPIIRKYILLAPAPLLLSVTQNHYQSTN